MTSRRRRARRGAILVIALVLVFILAALVIAMAARSRSALQVSANAVSAQQAETALRSAEQYVLALLTEAKYDPNFHVETLQERYFNGVEVGGGFFWIVRPDYNEPLLPAWGLVDETAKLDLNTEPFERMMGMPGMTEQLAANIIDWRDEDEEPTNGIGAESQTYAGRSPPYRAKNAPFESVEELLLVDGMTPEILYGPADQPPLGTQGGYGSGGLGQLHWQRRGFVDLFTVWSYTSTIAPDGRERLDTDGDEDALEELVSEILGDDRAEEIDVDDEPNIFQFALDSRLTVEDLRKLEPYLIGTGDRSGGVTVRSNGAIRGLINLNYAPREVLLAADEDADPRVVDEAIVTRRAQAEIFPGSIAWLLESSRGAVQQLDDDVTARGTHFSADIIAASADGRAFRRVRIVVDTQPTEPRIVWRRDWTNRGWPLDPQVLADLRAEGGRR